MPSALYTQIKQTTTAFAESPNKAKTSNDVSQLSAVLTKDCRRTFRPKSILEMMPPLAEGLSNEQYEQTEASSFDAAESMVVEITDMLVDEENKKSMVSSVTSVAVKTGEKFVFDFVFVLQLTEDGKLIKHVEEYVDTTEAAKFSKFRS